MASSPPKLLPSSHILLVLVFFYFSDATTTTATAPLVRSDTIQSECLLTAPSSVFLNCLQSTINEIQKVTSIVSQFSNEFGDFRLSNAINDCLDLLDFSSDELSLTLSATQNPNGKGNSTGNRSSDLRTWLSAALGNQDTCIDGFEGTNSFVKNLVAGGLEQVTSMIGNALSMVRQVPGGGNNKSSGMKLKTSSQNFPYWLKAGDRHLLQASTNNSNTSGGFTADVIVAADGTGNFTRVMDAVLAAPDHSSRRYVIYIKRGVYKENVDIKKKKWNLMMIGDGMDITVISGNRSFVDGWTTFRSATFAVAGIGFIARDLTIENTAGPEKHQAVALRSDSDLSAFFRCGIKGYQDTLYAHSLRQFYRECRITGTVDFIFGNGAVVFQSCQIFARKGLPNQKNTITAQGRKDPLQTTGFSIHLSNISADSDLLNSASANSTQTYLGRPWKQFSQAVIMQSYMSNVIRPEGWLEWQGNFALDTLSYGEYMNYGPGAGLGNRVTWPGFHVFNASTQVTNFTVAHFIDGNLWLPSTGVRYTAGLAV